MKKQIIEKGFSLLIMISFYVLIAIHFSSCRKHAGRDAEKPTSSTITYTDINPDSLIETNTTYNLDLDNDGVSDFSFHAFSNTVKCDPRSPVMGALDGTQVIIPNGSNNGIIFALNENYSACLDSLAMIDSSAQWSYVSSQALGMYILCTCVSGSYKSYGNWYISGINKNRYMGLKIIKGAGTYYGWVRLYLDINLRKIIIKDYAYNSIPDEPISAGQIR